MRKQLEGYTGLQEKMGSQAGSAKPSLADHSLFLAALQLMGGVEGVISAIDQLHRTKSACPVGSLACSVSVPNGKRWGLPPAQGDVQAIKRTRLARSRST